MKPADMDPDTWYGLADRFVPELYAVVKDLGGSISGEHGIGRKRARFLEAAVGTAEYTAMRAVKRALDPKNLLNPGVIFPQ